MKKQIIFSGVQPTGNLHLGNYLGAVKNWVELQNSGKYDCYFFIADYHSLTGGMTPEERHESTYNLAAEIIAAGVDPDKSTLFVQSSVPLVAELTWIFNTVTPIAELERMTQFKDKSTQQAKNINTGLFTYPILQAADILLYHGELVPVGQDQVQHVELTRDVARWFNNRYKKYFPETKPLLTKIPKVMSLLEPNKKMSKSKGENHAINLSDDPETIEKKIKKAVTASGSGESAPGVENLLLLLREFGEEKVYKQFVKAEKNGNIRYGDLKKEVSESLANYFADFRKKRSQLLANKKSLQKIMDKGGKKANKVAEKTMKDVRKIIGIR